MSNHFTRSLYVTGAFPAASLVLNPRGGGSAYVLSLCGLFKWRLLKIQEFFPPPQPLLIFTARTYGDLSSWWWNPGLCSLAWGWDCSLLRYPLNFYPPQVDVGLPMLPPPPLCGTPRLQASPSLLPIWINVASLNSWLPTPIQLNFLTVLGVICFEV